MQTLEMQRNEYGSIESPQMQFSGPLSALERQQIVDDILDSVKNPASQQYNAVLATEIQLWSELKSRSLSDAAAKAIVEMVRAGDKQLHEFFPPSAQAFIGKIAGFERHSGNGHSTLPSRYR